MDDDKTVIKPRKVIEQEYDSDCTILFHPEALNVSLLGEDGEIQATFSFTDNFTVGRALDNAIVVDSGVVSRHHLEVKRENGGWWLHDLGSVNGVYINGKLIEHKGKLNFPVLISLGRSSICLRIHKIEHEKKIDKDEKEINNQSLDIDRSIQAANPHRNLAHEEIKARLLAEEEAEDAGDYTRMVRKLIREDRTIRKKSYKKVIWALGVLFGLSISLAAYQQIALANTRKLAIEMFYDIKTLEVSLSKADIKIDESADALDRTMKTIDNEKLRIIHEQLKMEQEKVAFEKKRMLQEREKLANMKAKYRQYVKEANSLRLLFPTAEQYEEELIAKVARELGESELELPNDFVVEVKKYIQYWQRSSRMQKAMDNFEKNNYSPIVIAALKKHGLPLYFIYLPFQESNYDSQAIGPQTHFGIAKGAWQLLATTAQEYGISPGPLANVAEYDVQDARFNFEQSTQAGTKYLKHIYSTEAQASGLLVMASYNYGDNRVKAMIKKMSDNPRDKNFWKFIQQYELPKETHEYVFYIFSAAVIGEDPQHFGFKFNPPLFNTEANKAESADHPQDRVR